MPRMLLVADDVWVRNDVAAVVSDPGSILEVLDEPIAVVERLAEGDYELVVVDLQVKSAGGMSITRAVKTAIANGEIEVVPVLMLLDRRADVFLARRAGAEAWLVKPFTAQQFREALASLTGAAA